MWTNTPFYARVTFIVVGTIGVLWLLYIGQSIILPFMFALFIGVLLNPLVNFLSRKKVPRVISIFLSLILTFLVVGGVMIFIATQLSSFGSTFPLLKTKLLQVTNDGVAWAAEHLNVNAEVINRWVDNTVTQLTDSLNKSMGKTLLSVGNAAVIVFIIPVYIFLILYYKNLLLEFVKRLFKADHHTTVVEVLKSVNTIIRSYLLGLLLESLIVAVLNSAALLIIGVEYAILLGVIGAILNLIPYIGGIIAVALPMVMVLVTKSAVSSLFVLGAYAVIQFVDNNYIMPYVVASKVKINALVCIVVVLIGNALWGVPGMFLSIPLTALLKVICDHIEVLKPWGFVLGDTMPSIVRFNMFKRNTAGH